MQIGINASFARKENTGIGQVTINFLRKLIELKAKSEKRKTNDEFVLYLEEDIDLKLPDNFTKRIFLPFWKRDDLIRKIWWEKFLLPKKVKEDGCDVFISLYQCPTIITSPPHMRRGLRGGVDKFQYLSVPAGHLPSFEGRRLIHIMIVHDIIPKLFPEYLNNSRKKLYWKQTEKAIKKADKIIAISHRTEKDLVQHLQIPPEKISVDYIDVDEIYKKEINDTAGMNVLRKYNLQPGYIYSGGGLEIRKNIEGVIRAYNILYKKNKREKFVSEFPPLVISGKLMPELKPLVTDAEKLVKELNLTQSVKLLDFVEQEDLPAIHKNALMFIYPSKYEGFGLPVLEAMNQGNPVITSKTSSLPEVGGDSVLYCDPEDVHDLAMVIKNVLVNRELRETLSRRAKERAKNFSWEKFVGKVLNIIENWK